MRARREAAWRYLLYRAAKRELLKVAAVVAVQGFLHSDKHESGDREDDLHAFHAEFARTQRVLPPLRCGTTAQPANLGKDCKIQQRASQGEANHGDTEGVCVEAIYHRASTGAEHERAEADGEAQTIRRSKECADALQKGEEKAGPGDCTRNARRIFPHRDCFSGARSNWSRRHKKTSGERDFVPTGILHIDEGCVVTLNEELAAVRSTRRLLLRMRQNA